MSQTNARRGRAQNEARRREIQNYVDQDLTYREMGQRLGVTGERARQLVKQYGIKATARKRGRRPISVNATITALDLTKLRADYYGEGGGTPRSLAEIAKRHNISTNRLRKVVRTLKWQKREPLERPKARASRKYDLDLIRKLFVEDRWSDQRIAEHLRKTSGVKAYASYINKLRQEAGITRAPLQPSERRNSKGDQAERMEQMLRKGLTAKQVAAAIPCSLSYVYRTAAKHGFGDLFPKNRS